MMPKRPNRSALWCLIAFFGQSLGLCARAQAESEVITLPVKVYCYSFAAAPELNCSMGQTEIRNLIANVNRIWEQARIQFSLLSVTPRTASANDFPSLASGHDWDEIRRRQIAISPKDDGNSRSLKVVIVGQFPIPSGGVYRPLTRTIFFAERNARGEPQLASILAHEIGHSLSLSHTDRSNNLMRIGNAEEARSLTKEQIQAARKQAAKGAADVADMLGPDGDPMRIPRGGFQVGAHADRSSGIDMGQRRKRMVSRLRSFDRDGDGVIRREDVPSQARQVFDHIDRDGDGSIDNRDLDGFAKNPSNFQRSGSMEARQEGDASDNRARIVKRIKTFGHDGDGLVRREDLPPQAHQVFDRVDEDRDGKVDAAELEAFEKGPFERGEFLP